MELRFLAPDIRVLDGATVELCACTVWSDERPVRGLAGLLDWRLGGRGSALLKSGFFRGDMSEALLLPGKPHLPFEKVLLIGMGPRADFGDDGFRQGILRMATALEHLRIRKAVVELPGRASGAIAPEAAITLALDSIGASAHHDTWWLVETPADQKRTEVRAAEERRRVRTG